MPSSCSRLVFAQHDGQTRLVARQAELPLVVQRPLRGPAGQALLVLLTPAGALFGGDEVRLRVECGPGTDVTLATAGATRVNQGQVGFELQATVDAGATLRYLPHELIPFRGACYRQRLALDLATDGRAILLDVISPGRTSEPFAYRRLELDTQVSIEGRLVVRERLVLADEVTERLAGHTHYGSLFLLGERGETVTAEAMASLAERGACAGASLLPAAGIGLKMLGDSAQEVRDTLLRAAGSPGWLFHRLPA